MSSVLRLLPWSRSQDPTDAPQADLRLVEGLRGREPWATAALVDRYGDHVRRVLMRVLGTGDADFEELLQDVFMSAWEGIGRLRDPLALKAWLTHIAVFSARGTIRRRRRRRWLTLFPDVPEREAPWAGPDLRDAAQSVYQIFDRMPVDERIPFALRTLEGLDLEATAAACGMSLATTRRRLAKAERRFFTLARQYEALGPWLESR